LHFGARGRIVSLLHYSTGAAALRANENESHYENDYHSGFKAKEKGHLPLFNSSVI